jgi:hypothetical protein
VREGGGDLERPHDAPAGDLGGLEAGDVLALVEDPPARRRQELRQEIEERGLAGAVRADHRVDVAALELERHVLHGDEAQKGLGQAFSSQDDRIVQ